MKQLQHQQHREHARLLLYLHTGPVGRHAGFVESWQDKTHSRHGSQTSVLTRSAPYG